MVEVSCGDSRDIVECDAEPGQSGLEQAPIFVRIETWVDQVRVSTRVENRIAERVRDPVSKWNRYRPHAWPELFNGGQ
jgi:hypothetical protein